VSARGHVLPFLMLVIGIAIVVRTLVDGDPPGMRLILGVLFCAAGGARLWAETRRPGA
jgi:hypothetical protein